MTKELKWWHFSQNNSGGYFITNDDVAEDVFIQAYSAKQAANIAENLFEDYSDYCPCCGERWWIDCKESDGTAEPTVYGETIKEIEKRLFRTQARLVYLDGRIEKYFYKDKSDE